MKSALLICATLGAACCWALNDSLTTTNDVILDTRDTLPRLNSPFNNPPQIVNGEYITPLDHFLPTDRRKLLMSYQAHVQFLKRNGPIFVNIQLHTQQITKWITSGLAFDLAERLGGALVASDVRLYGRNAIANFTDEYYQYYTIEQIVGDVAHLVTQVRKNFAAQNSKVVIFGSGYGGLVATLARKQFPHLIDGVWSSNGIFSTKAPDFLDTTSKNIFNHGSAGCAKNLSYAFGNITTLVEKKNLTRLTQLFRICDNIDFSHPQDAANFYETVFVWIGDYINDNHIGGLQDICRDISRGPDPLTAFSRWVEYAYYNNNQCRNVSHAEYVRRRQRLPMYLQCAQLGSNYYVTSANATGNVFPNVLSIELFKNRCKDIFGNAFNFTLLQRSAENFNTKHGGSTQIVSNAIFSVGDLASNINSGIVEYDDQISEVVHTSLHSYEAEMTSISDSDTADLRATKRKIRDALRRFTEQRRPSRGG